MTVYNNGPDPTLTYLGIPSSNEIIHRDYSATTIGMQTQCKPVSSACQLTARYGASTNFYCISAFAGELQGSSGGWIYTYFTDEAMLSNQTAQGIENPYYYGLAALFKNSGGLGASDNDEEVVTPIHGGASFVLLCSITVFDVEYTSINGSITDITSTVSNNSLANIWQAPMAYVDVAQPNLKTAASVAVATSKNAQQLADQYALSYSKAALAVGAQSVRRAPAIAVQDRTTLLVTRLPMAPLFALVIANLIFVLLGIVLTVLAFMSSGQHAREVKARLSIAGLVACCFEGQRIHQSVEAIEELFEEYEGETSSRLSVTQATAGGYVFQRQRN